MSAPKKGQVGFVTAATAMREVMAKACSSELNGRQHRTLLAVLSMTGCWSKLEEKLYVGQLASIVYGVERAERWQTDAVGRELKVLAEKGLIEREPPKSGRFGGEHGPQYRVKLATDNTSHPERITEEMRSDPNGQCVSPRTDNTSHPKRPTGDSFGDSSGEGQDVDLEGTIVLLGPKATPAEFVETYRELVDTHGEPRAKRAVAALSRTRWSYRSDWRTALRRWLRENPPTAPARHPVDCPGGCGGSGPGFFELFDEQDRSRGAFQCNGHTPPQVTEEGAAA